MDNTVIVAVISGVCTLLGSSAGVIASSRLTAYRIEQLEKRVDKHNHLIERMYSAEDRISIQEEKLKAVSYRIGDIKGEMF